MRNDHLRPPEPDLADKVGLQLFPAAAVVDAVPRRDDLLRTQAQTGLAQGELPRHVGPAPAHADHRLVEPVGRMDVVAARHFDVAAAEHVDAGQVSFVAGKAGDQFQGHVVGVGKNSQQGRPGCRRPAAAARFARRRR